MKSKLVIGRHKEAGVTYDAPAVIESKYNLVELFPHKFEKVEYEQVPKPKKAKSKKAPVNVNEEFDFDPEHTGLNVFRSGKWYTVFDVDSPEKPLNESGLEKDNVMPYLESLTEQTGLKISDA